VATLTHVLGEAVEKKKKVSFVSVDGEVGKLFELEGSRCWGNLLGRIADDDALGHDGWIAALDGW
jgi:hypothetical protein